MVLEYSDSALILKMVDFSLVGQRKFDEVLLLVNIFYGKD